MKVNPNLHDVEVGDVFFSGIHIFQQCAWSYKSTVLKVDDLGTRFGKPDRILSVKVETSSGAVVDNVKQLWWSQLKQGLV